MRTSCLICFSYLSFILSHIIWEEQITKEDLSERVNRFNSWLYNINPSLKIKAQLNEKGKIQVIANEPIKVNFF